MELEEVCRARYCCRLPWMSPMMASSSALCSAETSAAAAAEAARDRARTELTETIVREEEKDEVGCG